MQRDVTSWAKRIVGAVFAFGLGLSLWSFTAEAQKPLPPSKMQYPLEWAFKTPPPRGTVTPGSACEGSGPEVRPWGLAGLAAERGHERARGVVADTAGHPADRLPRGDHGQRRL